MKRILLLVVFISSFTILGISNGWTQSPAICPAIIKYLKMEPQQFKPLQGAVNEEASIDNTNMEVLDSKKRLPGFEEGHILDYMGNPRFLLRFRSVCKTREDAAAKCAALKAQLDAGLNSATGFLEPDAEYPLFEKREGFHWYIVADGNSKIPKGGLVRLFYDEGYVNDNLTWKVEIWLHGE